VNPRGGVSAKIRKAASGGSWENWKGRDKIEVVLVLREKGTGGVSATGGEVQGYYGGVGKSKRWSYGL